MLGAYEVNVTVGKLPEAIATAFGKVNETLIGAEYTPIAYLGSQVVNGTNHAVLAEQLVTTGKDTKNVVLMIFNQKPEQVGDATLVNIERVVESGGQLGGIAVDVQTTIPSAAQQAFDTAFDTFVGADVTPFAYLGQQVTKGINYIYAAEVTPVVEHPVKKVAIVTVNEMAETVSFADILNNDDVVKNGYAFTWLR